jgi:hypothetical protein
VKIVSPKHLPKIILILHFTIAYCYSPKRVSVGRILLELLGNDWMESFDLDEGAYLYFLHGVLVLHFCVA